MNTIKKNERCISIKQDTPRLVVEYQPQTDASTERFGWGIVGSMPLLTLIGFITRVQAELAFRTPEECSSKALVIAWDVEERRFGYFVDPIIPVNSLVGMLETIKLQLISSQAAQSMQGGGVGIFGADGQPLHYRR